MLISQILKEMSYSDGYIITNERPFQYLALTMSEIQHTKCTFVESEKYIDSIKGSTTMVITKPELVPLFSGAEFGLCAVEQPKELFFSIHNFLSSKEGYRRVTVRSCVGKGCNISPLSSISTHNVILGDNVLIEEFAVIREDTQIGNNSIIRAGCVIGGQGYEFKRGHDRIMSVAHLGGVKIGDSVEIQYNTCVDRAVYPWDDTVIGDNTKIDNLVHIAHAVKIEKNVMVVANVGIGGRTVVKEGTWIGFAATVTNGIVIGENARANIGSVVTKSVADNGSVTGNFAINHAAFLQNLKNSLSGEV